MTSLEFDRVEYSVKETAAAMRSALRAAFPSVKFSVRMSRGTGHGWLSVTYEDGPRLSEVQEIAHGFESSRFEGMDDSYQQVEPALYAREDGSLFEIRWSCCGANVSRRYSDEATTWADTVAVRGSYWWPEGVDLWRDSAYYSSLQLLAGISPPATPTTPAQPSAKPTDPTGPGQRHRAAPDSRTPPRGSNGPPSRTDSAGGVRGLRPDSEAAAYGDAR